MKNNRKEELTIVKRVKREDGKCNLFINGKPLFEQWYKWIGYFNGEEFAKVQREDGKFNYITEDGKIISDTWFEWVEDEFHCDKARVKREDGLMNFITKQGKLLSEEWFKYACYFRYSDAFQTSFAMIDRTNGEHGIIYKTGEMKVCK